MAQHFWVDKRKLGDTIEITIRDASKAKIESWIINLNDNKRARQIMRILKVSYGIDFGVSDDKDLDWLKKS